MPENATDEQVKKAYRDLVKKYHPDKYADSDLADLANEKMKEVNAAYEEIEKMRKSGASSSGAYRSSDASYQNTGYSGSTSNDFIYVRNMINARNFINAYSRLQSTPQNARGAEWNYLMGCTLIGMGRVYDGRSYLERACAMEPGNLEYRAARDRAQSVSFGGFQTPSQGYGNGGCGCSSCDCLTCLCADSLCECCGGDLVPCC